MKEVVKKDKRLCRDNGRVARGNALIQKGLRGRNRTRTLLTAEKDRRLPADLRVTPPRLSTSLLRENSRGKLLPTEYYSKDR